VSLDVLLSYFWVGALDIVIQMIFNPQIITTNEVPVNGALWFLSALLLFYFHDIINIGFGKKWNRWPQVIVTGTGILLRAPLIIHCGCAQGHFVC
jgi:hypothetical protein